MTSVYKLYIWNADKQYENTVSSGASLVLATGTYNAVVLANGDTTSIPYAFGSAYKTEIVIEENKTTNVTFTMLPFGVEFVVPDEFYPAEDFDITLKIDTRNPYLSYDYSKGDSVNVPYLLAAYKEDSNSISKTDNVITITDTYTATTSVPEEDKNYTIKIGTIWILIRDRTYNYGTSWVGRYVGGNSSISDSFTTTKLKVPSAGSTTGMKATIDNRLIFCHFDIYEQEL